MIFDQKSQLEQMGDGWKRNVPQAYTKHRMMLRAYEMLLQAQDATDQEPEPMEGENDGKTNMHPGYKAE